jgi:CheY-like chemotaxis protein
MTKILIIDDSLLARTMLNRILKELGHEVIMATNGSEGLDMAGVQKPDCILLDFLLPDMNANNVLLTLKERKIDIPVIVLTANIQSSIKKECMESGAVAVLNKPAKKEEVSEIIERSLNL